MKRLPLVAAIVLVSLVGMVGVSRAADPPIQTVLTNLQVLQNVVKALQAQLAKLVPAHPRLYYLTLGNYRGAEANTTACASGFHMASLFEILDPSNLQYATKLAGAFKEAHRDQGLGPPVGVLGWIRTGTASAFNQTYWGTTNCNSWTSDLGIGTVVRLYPLWESLNNEWSYSLQGWWESATQDCDTPNHVWCVEDPW